MAETRIFLDTSAVFAGVFSASGGARALLQLGEVHAIQLIVGPSVLREADEVFRRKAPDLLPRLAMLLHQANVQTGPDPSSDQLSLAQTVVDYEPDQQVVAEALAAGTHYLATHDKVHLIANPRVGSLPYPVGTPGDCLAWLRERFQ
ncbi:MAG: PIN domain-containing protein [Anaerolineae bacterium]|nr:PIN domain-containing protein [Anaerolineae bacterium]